MVFVPTTYTPLKAVLLALTLIGIVAHAIRTRDVGLHHAIVGRTVLFAGVGTFFVTLGLINGNPGAWKMAPLFVAWPVVYTLLISGLAHEQRLRRVAQVLVFATFAIEVSIVVFLLRNEGLLPEFTDVGLDLGQRANQQLYLNTPAGSLREFDSYSLSSMLFLVPFLIGLLVFSPSAATMPVRRIWLWIATGVALPLVLLSGRRGLWLAVLIAPVIAVPFWTWIQRGDRTRSLPWRQWLKVGIPITATAMVILSIGLGYKINTVANWFGQGFDLTGGRHRQLDALLDGWRSSPVIGKGLGAVSDVVRSNTQPWAYELVYVALLFTTGIVGVALYLYGLVWIVRRGRQMARSGDVHARILLALLLGTAGMLVASATNPYITKFDSLWTIFLPIAYINYSMLSRERTG